MKSNKNSKINVQESQNESLSSAGAFYSFVSPEKLGDQKLVNSGQKSNVSSQRNMHGTLIANSKFKPSQDTEVQMLELTGRDPY